MATIDIPMSNDTMLIGSTPTTNYDTQTYIDIGEDSGSASTRRSWIKPDYSSIPTGARIESAILKLTPVTDSSTNARTMYAHRCLQSVVSSQATWNVYATGLSWGVIGAQASGTDYDATALGSMAVSAAPTLNTPLSMTLSASEIQKFHDGTYANNGIVLFVDTQVDDLISYGSTQNATAAYRPIITITYELSSFFFMFM